MNRKLNYRRTFLIGHISSRIGRKKTILGGIILMSACYLAAVFAGMARQLRGTYGGLPIVWAGGVMSNRRIRAQLEQLGDCRFAEPAFSADNAAGTALLCRRRYISECNE